MKIVFLLFLMTKISPIWIRPNENPSHHHRQLTEDHEDRRYQHHFHHKRHLNSESNEKNDSVKDEKIKNDKKDEKIVTNTKVMSTKSSNNALINANASSFSKGNGQSMAMAGPKGSNSMAVGEFGTGTTSGFNNLSSTIEDSWGFQMDNKGNSQKFGKKVDDKRNVSGQSKGGSKGQGSSKSGSNLEGSMSFGEGSEGSFSDSNFANNSNTFLDSWNVAQKSNGEYKQSRNTSNKKDSSKTSGSGMSNGKGKAMTKANNDGAMVKAEGEKGSKALTSHKGQSDTWGDAFEDSMIGGKKNVKSNKWTNKENSEGGTEGEAIGKGSVMGVTDRFKGSQGTANGAEGTINKAGWQGHSDSKKDIFSTELEFDGFSSDKPKNDETNVGDVNEN